MLCENIYLHDHMCTEKQEQNYDFWNYCPTVPTLPSPALTLSKISWPRARMLLFWVPDSRRRYALFFIGLPTTNKGKVLVETHTHKKVFFRIFSFTLWSVLFSIMLFSVQFTLLFYAELFEAIDMQHWVYYYLNGNIRKILLCFVYN